jgi:hypothetical protein
VLSWLVTFNVVNVRNPIVSQIGEFLFRVRSRDAAVPPRELTG